MVNSVSSIALCLQLQFLEQCYFKYAKIVNQQSTPSSLLSVTKNTNILSDKFEPTVISGLILTETTHSAKFTCLLT